MFQKRAFLELVGGWGSCTVVFDYSGYDQISIDGAMASGEPSHNGAMQIVSFSPIMGHCVFIPTADLPRFRTHVAHMTSVELEEYAPLSLHDEQPIQGGAHFNVGRRKTEVEVLKFLTHVIIDG